MAAKPVFQRSSKRAPHMWQEFAWLGDEWLASFASSDRHMPSVTLFSLAHAVELFLKGCVAKHHFAVCGDHEASVAEVMKGKHDLPGLWKAMKSYDSSFMHDYWIDDELLPIAFVKEESEIQAVVRPDQWEHFIVHRDFYLVMQFVADLKYFGGPLKKMMRPSVAWDDSYWIKFFREIREWLWRGEGKHFDNLSSLVAFANLNPVAVEYLKNFGLQSYGEPKLLYSFQSDEYAARLTADNKSAKERRPLS